MTSMRRFRISDRGQRPGSPGSAAIAVIFVVLANLMLFGVLAAVLLPRADARPHTGTVRAPAVAMAPASPSRATPPSRAAVAVDALPTPPAALAPLSVAPGSSLVLARSAHPVRRVCPPRDVRRVSVAQHESEMQGRARRITP